MDPGIGVTAETAEIEVEVEEDTKSHYLLSTHSGKNILEKNMLRT